VDHGAGRTAPDDRVAQRGHGEGCLHPRVDGVADDPPGEDVLDRAEVELALGRGVFGDAGQPQRVRRGRGEHAVDEVVVHRRTGPAGQALLLGKDRPDPLLRAQPGDPVLTCRQAAFAQLVGDEPVAEGGASAWMS
jgi:hypothetical protein